MKIVTKSGLSIEMNAEELRHFKLNNAKEIKSFINNIEEKIEIGFKSEKK